MAFFLARRRHQLIIAAPALDILLSAVLTRISGDKDVAREVEVVKQAQCRESS